MGKGYLIAAIILACIGFGNVIHHVVTSEAEAPAPTRHEVPAPPPVTYTPPVEPIEPVEEPPITVEDLRGIIFEEVNRIRIEHGLSALTRDHYLDTIADEHAFTMMAMGNATHWGFEDRADSIFAAMPNVTQVGENVAYVNIISYDTIGRYLAEGWYESPEHRENMLDSSYKRTGIGLQVFWENLAVPNYYAVQLFTD